MTRLRKRKDGKKRKYGQKYVDRLQEVIVVIGKDVYTREQLVVKGKSGNWNAAAFLSKVLQTFEPKSVKEVAKRIDMFMLGNFERFGDTARMVWLRILDDHKVSNDEWLAQDFTEVNQRRQEWNARKRKLARKKAA